MAPFLYDTLDNIKQWMYGHINTLIPELSVVFIFISRIPEWLPAERLHPPHSLFR